MIDRFLRRLTVGRRIVGGFLIMVVFLATTIPLTVANYSFLVSRLYQVTNVEARADRLLLLASIRIESSRVNLMRYLQDYLPSVQESLNDTIQAAELLQEAQGLITSPDQKAAVAPIVETLDSYKTLVGNVQAARLKGESSEATRLMFLASKTGAEMGQQIEQIVQDSETHVTAVNTTIYTETQTRLILMVAGYAGLLILAMVLVGLIQRSITRPVAELRSGAESFRQGRLETVIPVTGTDELSLLARTFNQMATQLSWSYLDLEQRVQDRTRELARRSSYLEASAEVGHAVASILETDQLIRQVVELIRERFDLYYVGLFLVDESGKWAVLRAGTGEAGKVMLTRGHRLQVGGSSMVGWSIAHAQARIALEAGEDAVHLATPELPNTRSEAALPLRSRGQIIGALTVQDVRPGAFDETAIVVLQTLADQVAVALDNARLYTESQTALEAMHHAYGKLTRQAWSDLLRTHSNWGYRYADKSITPATDAWRPEMLQVQQTGQTVHGDGTEKPTLVIPLKVRNQVIGVLDFHKDADGKAWTAEERALLETLTEQLGVALESARLYYDTQLRAAREQLVNEITARIRSSANVETVLNSAVREIGQVTGASYTSIDLELSATE